MTEEAKIILFDIDYTVFDTDVFKKSQLHDYSVYEEVHETLKKLAHIATLGIFSEGVIAFQQRKLKETNIEKYFLHEHVHLVSNKADAVEQMLKAYIGKGKIFLVDDKLSILALAASHYPWIFTIWVKRGIYAIGQKPISGFTPYATILNLRESVPIIQEA